VAVDNTIRPNDYIGKFWVDSLVHNKKAMGYLIDVIGEDKICLGSDYPFPLGEEHPGKLIEKMKLSKKTAKKLFYKNAEEWLDLK
jgi:aminocarboxymuconate-semialdehyde decarboxylase